MLSLIFQLFDILRCENIAKHYANEKNIKVFQLLLEKWITLKELVYILQIPYNATVAFQKQTLALSDVYGRWTSMHLHLQQCKSKSSYKTGLVDHLLEALMNRSERIFKNPLMICALYLDPRFRSVVTQNSEMAEQAKRDLMNIWHRLNEINGINTSLETNNNENSNSDLSFEFDEENALAQQLQPRNQIEVQEPTQISDEIEMELELFQPEMLSPKCSVHEYWESVKEEHKKLYKLAMVIFSIPPTEVQIERDFSSLDVVFTNRRGNLSSSRLEDIFLIHLNKDLFYNVNNDDINELNEVLCRAK